MPRPTSQDLAGFWDLLQLSIEDVSMKFDELHQLKLNEWKIIESPERKVSRPWAIPFPSHLQYCSFHVLNSVGKCGRFLSQRRKTADCGPTCTWKPSSLITVWLFGFVFFPFNNVELNCVNKENGFCKILSLCYIKLLLNLSGFILKKKKTKKTRTETCSE